jgi:flavin reductase (DIM6/NTAB) family NADH-FMN oxidoreductase RutF
VSVFVPGAPLSLDCAVTAEIPAGDHDIVLLSVLALRVRPDAEPMVFHGGSFRRLADEAEPSPEPLLQPRSS